MAGLGRSACPSRSRAARRRQSAATRRGEVLRGASSTAWEAGNQPTWEFASEAEYLAFLEKDGALPAGFRVGTAPLTFVPVEAPDLGELAMRLTVICADEPTESYAAVFTSNAFPGAPVLVGRERLAGGAPLQAIVVNNKVSNVFPLDGGVASSEAVCAAAATALGLPGGASSVLPCSTGVIGWRLPRDELAGAMPAAAAALQGGSVVPAAKGIMTTDRYPKMSCATFPGGGRLVGIAKGAGMIEPDMATMLCYLLTDVEGPEGGRGALQALLADAVASSFNACSVDGDESTSDTVALLCSGRVPRPPVATFAAALNDVCRDLASQVVRNGEGTAHVIRVVVTGAASDAEARRLGKAVVNGPLFKTAVAGNDPNVGRLVAKVGQTLGKEGAAMTKGCVCKIGGEAIFEGGRFVLDGAKEKRLASHMRAAQMDPHLPFPQHGRVVDVEVLLGGTGVGRAVVLGSDLTKEYVEVNSDYRS